MLPIVFAEVDAGLVARAFAVAMGLAVGIWTLVTVMSDKRYNLLAKRTSEAIADAELWRQRVMVVQKDLVRATDDYDHRAARLRRMLLKAGINPDTDTEAPHVEA